MQCEMEEKRQNEIEEKGKMPECRNCGEAFSPDHQCFEPTRKGDELLGTFDFDIIGKVLNNKCEFMWTGSRPVEGYS